MSDLICPHCRNKVPRGATVCRGCHAELKYGPSNGPFAFAAIASLVVGAEIDKFLPSSLSVVGWFVGAACFIGIAGFIKNHYKDRVVFRRVYRTR